MRLLLFDFSVREVEADNGGGEFVHADSLPASVGRA